MSRYINPFLANTVSESKPNARRNLFKEAAALGHLVKNSTGHPYILASGSPTFTFGTVDLTSPPAAEWFAGAHAQFVHRSSCASLCIFGNPWLLANSLHDSDRFTGSNHGDVRFAEIVFGPPSKPAHSPVLISCHSTFASASTLTHPTSVLSPVCSLLR